MAGGGRAESEVADRFGECASITQQLWAVLVQAVGGLEVEGGGIHR